MSDEFANQVDQGFDGYNDRDVNSLGGNNADAYSSYDQLELGLDGVSVTDSNQLTDIATIVENTTLRVKQIMILMTFSPFWLLIARLTRLLTTMTIQLVICLRTVALLMTVREFRCMQMKPTKRFSM